MFEDPHATSQHVQFSSRRPPGEILAALEAAAVGMGGSAQIRGEKRCEGAARRRRRAGMHAGVARIPLPPPPLTP